VPDPAIRSYMDEVSFEDGGREVHLRKNPVTARLRSSMPSRPVPFFTPPAPLARSSRTRWRHAELTH
jgi:hypothetical protein